MTRLEGNVTKGWGSEEIWVTNDRYCSKFMHFEENKKFSMHFHAVKEETWYVISGKFLVKWIDTKDASSHMRYLMPGDTWHNPPLQPHQQQQPVVYYTQPPPTVVTQQQPYYIHPSQQHQQVNNNNTTNNSLLGCLGILCCCMLVEDAID